MAPKFAWPFRKVIDEQDQDQDEDQEFPRSTRLPTKDNNVRPPGRVPTPIIIPESRAPEPKPREKQRPVPIMWTQLTLRMIALLASISALTIAIYVAVGPIQRAWPVVLVSVS